MNLAGRDIQHNIGRFVLTTFGVGLLLMIVMGMGGIYRGLVQDATLLVDRLAVDLWIVQKDTRGPFAEVSRIPRNIEDRILAVQGVFSSHAFVSHTMQRERNGKPLRITVQGLSWPQDKGDWLPITAGRALRRAHYEMLADESLKLPLGEKIKFGKDIYTVVGLTRAMTSPAGDGMAFFSCRCPGDSVRYIRRGGKAGTFRAFLKSTKYRFRTDATLYRRTYSWSGITASCIRTAPYKCCNCKNQTRF